MKKMDKKTEQHTMKQAGMPTCPHRLPKAEMEEEELLHNFNNGLLSAYNTIFLKFYNELFYYARKLFANTTIEGDDILQECFLNLWEKRNMISNLFHILKTISIFPFKINTKII